MSFGNRAPDRRNSSGSAGKPNPSRFGFGNGSGNNAGKNDNRRKSDGGPGSSHMSPFNTPKPPGFSSEELKSLTGFMHFGDGEGKISNSSSITGWDPKTTVSD